MNKILTLLAKIDPVDPDNGPSAAYKPETSLGDNVTDIVNAVIGVLGIVAVVIIIIGGVTYMTSSGDASKVKKAKDTILYGVIGLIVVALAFAIVNFVILNVLKG